MKTKKFLFYFLSAMIASPTLLTAGFEYGTDEARIVHEINIVNDIQKKFTAEAGPKASSEYKDELYFKDITNSLYQSKESFRRVPLLVKQREIMATADKDSEAYKAARKAWRLFVAEYELAANASNIITKGLGFMGGGVVNGVLASRAQVRIAEAEVDPEIFHLKKNFDMTPVAGAAGGVALAGVSHLTHNVIIGKLYRALVANHIAIQKAYEADKKCVGQRAYFRTLLFFYGLMRASRVALWPAHIAGGIVGGYYS